MLRTWGTAHILTEQFLWDESLNAFPWVYPLPAPFACPPMHSAPTQSGGWCFRLTALDWFLNMACTHGCSAWSLLLS